jgi:membrane protease YdiL (CAAX protease family)
MHHPDHAHVPLDAGLRESPDRGTSRLARVCSLLVLLAVGALFVLQQWRAGPQQPLSAPATPNEQKVVAPSNDDLNVVQSSMQVKLAHVPARTGSSGKSSMYFFGVQQPQTPVERFRQIIVDRELHGKASAEASLAAFGEVFEGLADDRSTLEALLNGRHATLPPEALARFEQRHGYFARLAESWQYPDADERRAKFIRGGGAGILAIVLFILFLSVAALASLVSIIYLALRWRKSGIERRFVPPARGGSVFIETVLVFMASFLGFSIGMELLAASMTPAGGSAPEWLGIAKLLGQWLLLLTIFWPVVRGTPWQEWKHRVGWHRGTGVLREIAAGMVGYFAGLWLMALAVLVVMGYMLIKAFAAKNAGGPSPAVPSNPLQEYLTSAGSLQLALVFLLATCWAPIVEETVFRGSLHRHLRSWAGAGLASVLTGLTFGLIHGYAGITLLPVITLGVVFSFVREWRGSIIGPMVAHFAHNATVLLLVVTLLRAIRVPL